jgi:hypothetical protein
MATFQVPAHGRAPRGLPFYAFDHGFPTPEATRQAHNDADLSRAVEAYQFFYPTVSVEAVIVGPRKAGVEDNRHAMIMACGPRHLVFTGNSDTPYFATVLDLKSGPMVVEVPKGPFLGMVNDHNFRWVGDVGLPGPDRGNGGKHLIVPPGHAVETHPGYFTMRSPTYKVLFALRVLPPDGDMNAGLEALRAVKVHPLALADKPPPFACIDCTDRELDLTILEWESSLRFWEQLHSAIDEEPAIEEFRPMYGLLAGLGIEKGKPFAPDPRMKAILDIAARAGRKQMLVAGFGSTRPDRFAWMDRKWEWAALCHENGDFELPTGIDLEARDRWFSQAVGASPKMFLRTAGAGSLYWLGLRDANGEYLDGGKSYRLVVPGPVPANLFWSVTVYDAETRSQIQTAQDKAALRSLVELKDTSKDGAIELYFGPRAPAGGKGRWIETIPGKGWFSYFRLYGPSRPAFDGSWRPGDFEAIG